MYFPADAELPNTRICVRWYCSNIEVCITIMYLWVACVLTDIHLHCFSFSNFQHAAGEKETFWVGIASLSEDLICSDAKLLMPVHVGICYCVSQCVVIFGSPLLNIVTVNGCCCMILHNNSEFPARTWKEAAIWKRQESGWSFQHMLSWFSSWCWTVAPLLLPHVRMRCIIDQNHILFWGLISTNSVSRPSNRY